MRNKVIVVVALLFVIIFALTLTGCSPKITDITVDWGNLEATIVAGTDLDLSGLSVTGTLKKDEEQIEITPDGEEEGYTVDLGGFNKDVPGTYTITITYQDFSQTFTVTVEALVMTGITVEGTLTNPVYTGADTIDLTGLTIKKVFNNGTEQNLEYTQVTTDIATVASVSGTEKTLTISYTEGEVVKTATITIQVSDISLDHIGISGDITNEIFAGDTTIDLAGLTVTKYYNDGTTGAVSLAALTTDIATIAASAGEGKTLTLSYTEGGITKTATVGIEVTALSLSSITISGTISSIVYEGDSAVDLTGLTITKHYNNGALGEVSLASIASDISTVAVSAGADKNLTLSYEEGGITKTVQTQIDVIDVVLTSITATGTLEDVYQGAQSIDLSGLTITKEYNNGETGTVNLGLVTTNIADVATNFGNGLVLTLTYIEDEVTKQTTISVNVLEIALQSISITGTLSNEVYEGDTTIDLGGIIITKTYNDTNTGNVSLNDVVTDITTVAATPGLGKTLTITYTEGGISKEATLVIDVIAKALSTITVTGTITDDVYVGDTTIDLTGLTITKTLNNGDTSAVAYGNVSTDILTIAATAGTGKTLTISYTEGEITKQATTTIDVTAVVLESITVTGTITDDIYEGDTTIDLTGLIITKTYNNGEAEDVDIEDVTSDIATVSSTSGTGKTLTISYTEGEITKTDTTLIDVIELVIVSIEVTGSISADIYEGDTEIDLTGLTITKTYNSGATAPVSLDDVTTDIASVASTSGNGKDLTISYTEDLTTKSDITVIDVIDLVLVSISATGSVASPVYEGANGIDLTGITITKTYNSGKTGNVSLGAVSTNIEDVALTPGEDRELTITYTEEEITKTTTVLIEVLDFYLSSLTYTGTLTNPTIYEGATEIDLTGLTFTRHYSNGGSGEVTLGSITTDIETVAATAGTNKTLTMTYMEWPESVSATIQINVLEVVVTSITVSGTLTNPVYEGDTEIDLTGISIEKEYNNGVTGSVLLSAVSTNIAEVADLAGAGVTLTISYTEGEITVTDTLIIEVLELLLTEITVTGYITNPIYKGDLTVDLTGLTITASYNNGDTAEIDYEDVTTNIETVTLMAGESKNLTISYTEGEITKTDTTEVEVLEIVLSSISVTGVLTVDIYEGDTTIDITELTITKTYNNGDTGSVDTEDVTTDIATVAATSGNAKTLTISYTEGEITKTDTTTIDVIALAIVSITVSGTLTNPVYVGDTEIDLTGITIEKAYNNGNTGSVLISAVSTNIAEVATTEGVGKSLTISYTEEEVTVSDSLSIDVLAIVLTGIDVTGSITNPIYQGDVTVDLTGITITASYNNGDTAVIDYEDVTTTIATVALNIGTYNLTISYTEGESTKADNVEIEVLEVLLSSIDVSGEITIDIYEGDTTIDITELIITKTYNNGDTGSVDTEDVTTDIATVAATSGTGKTLTISYTEGEITKTDTTLIDVIALALVSIEVTGSVSGDIYEGDTTIDLTGLTVTKTYNSGATASVSLEDVSTDIATVASVSGLGKTLTLSYTEEEITKTTTIAIDVLELVLTEIAIEGSLENIIYEGDTTIDLTGLTITATYNSSATKELLYGEVTTNNIQTLAATPGEDKTLTISYLEKGVTKTDSILVDVVEVVVSSISATGSVIHTVYEGDTTIDLIGVAITKTYNNGTTGTVALVDITTDISSVSVEPGIEKILTLTYEEELIEVSTTIRINVVEVVMTSFVVEGTLTEVIYVGATESYLTGLTLTAIYNNGFEDGLVYSDVSTDLLTVAAEAGNDKTLTITYDDGVTELSDTITIDVIPIFVDSIEVTGALTNAVYEWDETIDLTGLTITKTNNNSSTAGVLLSAVTTDIETVAATYGDSKTLTISYSEVVGESTVTVTDTISIDVLMLTPSDIIFTGTFDENNYVYAPLTIGSATISIGFNYDEIEEAYARTHSVELADLSHNYETEATTAGTHDITFTYTLNSVTATEVVAVTVSAAYPTAMEYEVDYEDLPNFINYVGDTLDDIDLHGLVFTAYFSDSSERILNRSEVTIVGFDSSIPVTGQELTFEYTLGSYDTVTAGALFVIDILAVEMTSISASGSLSNTVFEGATTIDLTGITITKHYNNGDTDTVAHGSVSTDIETVAATAGTGKTLEISYTEGEITKTTTISINVVAIVVASISIDSGTISDEVYEGDTYIDLTGLVISKTYNDLSTGSVDLVDITTNIETVASTYGEDKTLTLSYTEGGITVSTTVLIDVIEVVLESFSITSYGLIDDVFEGDTTIDLSDYSFEKTYNNGSYESIPYSEVTTDIITVAATAGYEKTLTISYTEGGITKSTTILIDVNEIAIEGIEIVGTPLIQYVGEEFDFTGLTVNYVYNNGDKEEVQPEDLTTNVADITSYGEYAVQITADETYYELLYEVLFYQVFVVWNDFRIPRYTYYLNEEFDNMYDSETYLDIYVYEMSELGEPYPLNNYSLEGLVPTSGESVYGVSYKLTGFSTAVEVESAQAEIEYDGYTINFYYSVVEDSILEIRMNPELSDYHYTYFIGDTSFNSNGVVVEKRMASDSLTWIPAIENTDYYYDEDADLDISTAMSTLDPGNYSGISIEAFYTETSYSAFWVPVQVVNLTNTGLNIQEAYLNGQSPVAEGPAFFDYISYFVFEYGYLDLYLENSELNPFISVKYEDSSEVMDYHMSFDGETQVSYTAYIRLGAYTATYDITISPYVRKITSLEAGGLPFDLTESKGGGAQYIDASTLVNAEDTYVLVTFDLPTEYDAFASYNGGAFSLTVGESIEGIRAHSFTFDFSVFPNKAFRYEGQINITQYNPETGWNDFVEAVYVYIYIEIPMATFSVNGIDIEYNEEYDLRVELTELLSNNAITGAAEAGFSFAIQDQYQQQLGSLENLDLQVGINGYYLSIMQDSEYFASVYFEIYLPESLLGTVQYGPSGSTYIINPGKVTSYINEGILEIFPESGVTYAIYDEIGGSPITLIDGEIPEIQAGDYKYYYVVFTYLGNDYVARYGFENINEMMLNHSINRIQVINEAGEVQYNGVTINNSYDFWVVIPGGVTITNSDVSLDYSFWGDDAHYEVSIDSVKDIIAISVITTVSSVLQRKYYISVSRVGYIDVSSAEAEIIIAQEPVVFTEYSGEGAPEAPDKRYEATVSVYQYSTLSFILDNNYQGISVSDPTFWEPYGTDMIQFLGDPGEGYVFSLFVTSYDLTTTYEYRIYITILEIPPIMTFTINGIEYPYYSYNSDNNAFCPMDGGAYSVLPLPMSVLGSAYTPGSPNTLTFTYSFTEEGFSLYDTEMQPELYEGDLSIFTLLSSPATIDIFWDESGVYTGWAGASFFVTDGEDYVEAFYFYIFDDILSFRAGEGGSQFYTVLEESTSPLLVYDISSQYRLFSGIPVDGVVEVIMPIEIIGDTDPSLMTSVDITILGNDLVSPYYYENDVTYTQLIPSSNTFLIDLTYEGGVLWGEFITSTLDSSDPNFLLTPGTFYIVRLSLKPTLLAFTRDEYTGGPAGARLFFDGTGDFVYDDIEETYTLDLTNIYYEHQLVNSEDYTEGLTVEMLQPYMAEGWAAFKTDGTSFDGPPIFFYDETDDMFYAHLHLVDSLIYAEATVVIEIVLAYYYSIPL